MDTKKCRRLTQWIAAVGYSEPGGVDAARRNEPQGKDELTLRALRGRGGGLVKGRVGPLGGAGLLLVGLGRPRRAGLGLRRGHRDLPRLQGGLAGGCHGRVCLIVRLRAPIFTRLKVNTDKRPSRAYTTIFGRIS